MERKQTIPTPPPLPETWLKKCSLAAKMSAQVTLVVPCYNEVGRLPTEEFAAGVLGWPEARILFVNDGSKDDTATVLEELVARNPLQMSVLHLSQNSGKAEAVRRGCLEAAEQTNSSLIGFADADLAVSLSEMRRLADYLADKPTLHLLAGSRLRGLGCSIERTLFRRIQGRAFAALTQKLLGLGAYDTQCGAKIFRSELTPLLFDEPFLSRWCFDIEMLKRLSLAYGEEAFSQSVYELPLHRWVEQGGSKVSLATPLRMAGELWQIRQHYKKSAAIQKLKIASVAVADTPSIVEEKRDAA